VIVIGILRSRFLQRPQNEIEGTSLITGAYPK